MGAIAVLHQLLEHARQILFVISGSSRSAPHFSHHAATHPKLTRGRELEIISVEVDDERANR